MDKRVYTGHVFLLVVAHTGRAGWGFRRLVHRTGRIPALEFGRGDLPRLLPALQRQKFRTMMAAAQCCGLPLGTIFFLGDPNPH